MSIKFDNGAGNQAIVIPATAELDMDPFTTEFTLSVWFNTPTGVSGNGTFISKRSSISTGWQFGIINNVIFGRLGGIQTDGTTLNPNDNTWHHGVLVNFDSAGVKRIKLFLDGVNEGVILNASGNGSNIHDVLINARRNNSVSDFTFIGNHTLSDIRIYKNRALSDEEILSLYTLRGKDQDFQNMTARWLLNEKSPDATVSGVGSVRDWLGEDHGSPNSSPVYKEDILSFGRSV